MDRVFGEIDSRKKSEETHRFSSLWSSESFENKQHRVLGIVLFNVYLMKIEFEFEIINCKLNIVIYDFLHVEYHSSKYIPHHFIYSRK